MKRKLLSGLMASAMMLSLMTGAAWARENMLIAPNPNGVIATQGFQDLGAEHWCYQSAQRLLELGYLHMEREDRFAPNAAFTKGMLVESLWKMSGSPVVNFQMSYEDVKEGDASTEAIRWALSEQIAVAADEKSFGAEAALTREQAAQIVYSYVQKYDMGFKGAWMFRMPFEDVAEIAEDAFEPMCWCYMSGLYSGCSETKLMPKAELTRAQAAVLLADLLDVAAEKHVDLLQYGKAAR